VPTAKFFEVVKKLEAIGDLLHKDVQVEDVSEEFRDASLRLKNARQVRDRLAALLANAKTVEESLKVERELERLSAEIERLEGRLKYLRDRATYSTITISFQPTQPQELQRQKIFKLPFPWLSEMGLGRLLTLH
jgi:predicted  nucleic acid-binding Zn-ribbon protein